MKTKIEEKEETEKKEKKRNIKHQIFKVIDNNTDIDSMVDDIYDFFIKEKPVCNHIYDVFGDGFSKCIYCGISDPNEE